MSRRLDRIRNLKVTDKDRKNEKYLIPSHESIPVDDFLRGTNNKDRNIEYSLSPELALACSNYHWEGIDWLMQHQGNNLLFQDSKHDCILQVSVFLHLLSKSSTAPQNLPVLLITQFLADWQQRLNDLQMKTHSFALKERSKTILESLADKSVQIFVVTPAVFMKYAKTFTAHSWKCVTVHPCDKMVPVLREFGESKSQWYIVLLDEPAIRNSSCNLGLRNISGLERPDRYLSRKGKQNILELEYTAIILELTNVQKELYKATYCMSMPEGLKMLTIQAIVIHPFLSKTFENLITEHNSEFEANELLVVVSRKLSYLRFFIEHFTKTNAAIESKLVIVSHSDPMLDILEDFLIYLTRPYSRIGSSSDSLQDCPQIILVHALIPFPDCQSPTFIDTCIYHETHENAVVDLNLSLAIKSMSPQTKFLRLICKHSIEESFLERGFVEKKKYLNKKQGSELDNVLAYSAGSVFGEEAEKEVDSKVIIHNLV